ncbi:MAG: class I SAM-dependent methyltransferase [Halioglobus sp.]
MITVGVAAGDGRSGVGARALADRLKLPLLPTAVVAETLQQPAAVLFISSAGLYLQQTGKGAPGPVAVDFGNAGMRHRRRAGQNEMLGRAVGVAKKPSLQVVDATAGLGRDSFVLADLGCRVCLCERNPLITELLMDGLAQARVSGDTWLMQVCERMELYPGDARELGAKLMPSTDVIYLDPMFPARSKSASVKKEMALFQSLLDSGDMTADGEALLDWSLSQEVARVVVKRPAKAPVLAGRRPSHEISGKAVRYDVYVLGALV